MYKYGEKILVGCNGEDGWWEEIFIAEANGVVFVASSKNYFDKIMKGHERPYVYTKHKPITKKKVIPYTLETFPLDNSGMIRGKDCFATILEVDRYGVTFCMDGEIKGFLYDKLAENFEWLNKDGTTTPFGVEVDDE